GRRRDATNILRTAARQSFAQGSLFDATAQALLESPADSGQVTEAIRWAQRACAVTRFHDPAALSTLASAYAAAGQFGDAIDNARKARDLAATQGNQDLVTQLERRQHEYENLARSRQPQ